MVGCTKCSPGCEHCYAEKFAARLAKNPATAKKYAGVVDENGRWTGKISSTEALLALRTLAEKATPGPWIDYEGSIYQENDGHFWIADVGCTIEDRQEERAHIAANSPDVVMANIDEILRMRAEKGRLEREADCLATWLANAYLRADLLPDIDNGMSPQDPAAVRKAARDVVEEKA